ncbi:MAG TPA: hypothetical protein VGN83_08445 [Falsiroseomonas sp.]|jgi:nitroreductase|nr:hypothetical protein [Falsiroseomonas sp.]
MDSTLLDDPWAVDPAGFADCHGSGGRLRFLLNYAVLAPSGHNTQPWLFRLCGDALLELRADRSRALPVVDPQDRELTISCSAALANLRHAAAALGEQLEVAVLPDPGDRDLLAVIRALGPCPAAPASARLLRAITARRTTRFAFAPDPLPAPLRTEVAAAAEEAGAARLHWFDTQGQRRALAALVAEGDRIQMADPAFRHELSTWMRSRRGSGRDGMAGAAFGMPDLLTFAASLAVRTFDMGAGQAARDQELAEGAPALAVLATPGDTPDDWMAAGEALQRMLLAVTAGGFTASFLNQPIEVAALRPRLAAELATAGVPQMLLRIGRGPRPIPAARRPVREVLREPAAPTPL